MRRRVLPSGGLFFALVAVVAGSLVSTFRVFAFDTFWHLASGQWIVEHRQLPEIDPFRFTSREVPWVDHEWLSQLLFRGVETLSGLVGLGLFRAAIGGALALALYGVVRRGGTSPPWAAFAAVLGVWLARPRLLLRPELFTLLGLALLLYLLERLREDREARWLLSVPLLVAPWVNLHLGALIAPVVVGLYLFGRWLQPVVDKRGTEAPDRDGLRPSWPLVMGLPLACLGALLINPYGVAVLGTPFHISDALREIQSVNPEWLSLWRTPVPAVMVMATVCVALVLIRAVQPRLGVVPDLATGLVAFAMLALAVDAVRHQGLFSIAAVVFVAREAASAVRAGRLPVVRPDLARLAALVLSALVVMWCWLPPPRGPLRQRTPVQPGLGLAEDRYPEQAVDTLERWPEVGPIYNDVSLGGYLLWRTWPPRQVFIDGRNEVNSELLVALDRSWFDQGRWDALLERWGIDGGLVEYDERPRLGVKAGREEDGPVTPRVTIHTLLFPQDRFALVEWDDAGMLFVRRTPERASRLEKEEWQFLHPENWRESVRLAFLDPNYRKGLEAELERKLTVDPANRRALQIASVLLAGAP